MVEILIVDDDEGMRSILSVFVERLGHNPSRASSLKEGIQAASSKAFDVVFLDLIMPDGNGLSALAKFRTAQSTELSITEEMH